MALSFMEGNEAIGFGAMEAGCEFFAGYPITPATTVFNTMLKFLPQNGGVCIQGEDEIASIGYCLGASMAGKKVMTATSGPGISLYSEQISFAIGSEIPIVIINIQRLGPSTGSATRGADSDIQFMRWGNTSGLPSIVLAPTSAKDCFELTMHAFNLAEEYRCPVFIASNKEIAMTKESFDIDKIEKPKIKNRKKFNGENFLPFEIKAGQKVPDFLPIGDNKHLVRQTSSTHGESGYITTSTEEIAKFQARLKNKLEKNVDDFSYFEELKKDGGETLIITYGVTARSAKEFFFTQKKNDKTSVLILKTLWPVPERLIKEKAKNYKNILVIEMNLGQYVCEIKRILPDKKNIKFLGKMDSTLISPNDIKEAIDE